MFSFNTLQALLARARAYSLSTVALSAERACQRALGLALHTDTKGNSYAKF